MHAKYREKWLAIDMDSPIPKYLPHKRTWLPWYIPDKARPHVGVPVSILLLLILFHCVDCSCYNDYIRCTRDLHSLAACSWSPPSHRHRDVYLSSVCYVPRYINSYYHYYSHRRASELAFSTPRQAVDFLYSIHYYNWMT